MHFFASVFTIEFFAEKENSRDAIERNTKGRTVKLVATFYKPTNLKGFWPASVLFFFVSYWYFSLPFFFAQCISKTHSVLGTMLPERVPEEAHCAPQENILNNKTQQIVLQVSNEPDALWNTELFSFSTINTC